jgi:acyl-coenzyme A synthetase/AMP-(fatty) acid ligase
LGRTTDIIINVGGNNVYPAEVKRVLLEMENVADVVCFAEPNPIMGERSSPLGSSLTNPSPSRSTDSAFRPWTPRAIQDPRSYRGR